MALKPIHLRRFERNFSMYFLHEFEMCFVDWNFYFICFVCRRMDNSKMHCEKNNLLSFLSTSTSTQIETYFTSLLCGCQCLSDCECLTCKLCRVVSLHNTCTHIHTQTSYVYNRVSFHFWFSFCSLFHSPLFPFSIAWHGWRVCSNKHTHPFM